ncbi:hypothetical protein ACWELV_04430 [Streptomyces mirabilis]
MRTILCCDAQGDADLARGWVMLAVGLAVASVSCFGVTAWYNRKGLHRVPVPSEVGKVTGGFGVVRHPVGP